MSITTTLSTTGTEHIFTARDGTPIHMRRLLPSDAPQLLEIYDHLNPQNRLMRFNLDTSEYDPAEIEAAAERLAALDTTQGVAWLALAELPDGTTQPVGGIRLLYVPPDGAEVALSVRDDWQRLGIATGMVAHMLTVAPTLGIRHFFGMVRAENKALLGLIQHLDVPVRIRDNGATVYLDLDLARYQLPHLAAV